jgi:hypothetical protein
VVLFGPWLFAANTALLTSRAACVNGALSLRII